jgi:hypothetical protein
VKYSVEDKLRDAIRRLRRSSGGDEARQVLAELWDATCAGAVRHLHAAVSVKRALDRIEKGRPRAALRALLVAAEDLGVEIGRSR